MNKVSIIIPVTRPKLAERCVDAIIMNAGVRSWHYEIITEEDTERIGCPSMVRMLTDKTDSDLVCFVGDDSIPQPDFLINALWRMSRFPGGYGIVGFNNLFDGETKNQTAGHFLGHKNMLPLLGGEFFHSGYWHSYCDNELAEHSKELGRFKWAKDAKIENPHPTYNKSVEYDDIYKWAYSQEIRRHDLLLYRKRRKNNWKLT